jgi:hypothetical protein
MVPPCNRIWQLIYGDCDAEWFQQDVFLIELWNWACKVVFKQQWWRKTVKQHCHQASNFDTNLHQLLNDMSAKGMATISHKGNELKVCKNFKGCDWLFGSIRIKLMKCFEEIRLICLNLEMQMEDPRWLKTSELTSPHKHSTLDCR